MTQLQVTAPLTNLDNADTFVFWPSPESASIRLTEGKRESNFAVNRLFRTSILYPAGQQVDIRLAKFATVLGHGFKPAFVLDGTQKTISLGGRFSGGISAEVIAVFMKLSVMAA